MFSSDIGHWDVPDLGTVLAETYALVEKGFMREDDFRDSTFTNGLAKVPVVFRPICDISASYPCEDG